MSGSGPTVFALFTDKSRAEQAAEQMKREFSLKECFVTGFYRTAKEWKGEEKHDRNKV